MAELDKQLAHRLFSSECFNRAWELIDKPQRTSEEGRRMLLLTLASLFHWTQREDCVPRNLSIGYWQAARVFALLGQADNAREFAGLCLEQSAHEGPFVLGYAYEALARAEHTAGDVAAVAGHLQRARELAAQVFDPEERGMLEADLQTLS
jgi:hypothetical protein